MRHITDAISCNHRANTFKRSSSTTFARTYTIVATLSFNGAAMNNNTTYASNGPIICTTSTNACIAFSIYLTAINLNTLYHRVVGVIINGQTFTGSNTRSAVSFNLTIFDGNTTYNTTGTASNTGPLITTRRDISASNMNECIDAMRSVTDTGLSLGSDCSTGNIDYNIRAVYATTNTSSFIPTYCMNDTIFNSNTCTILVNFAGSYCCTAFSSIDI